MRLVAIVVLFIHGIVVVVVVRLPLKKRKRRTERRKKKIRHARSKVSEDLSENLSRAPNFLFNSRTFYTFLILCLSHTHRH